MREGKQSGKHLSWLLDVRTGEMEGLAEQDQHDKLNLRSNQVLKRTVAPGLSVSVLMVILYSL